MQYCAESMKQTTMLYTPPSEQEKGQGTLQVINRLLMSTCTGQFTEVDTNKHHE